MPASETFQIDGMDDGETNRVYAERFAEDKMARDHSGDRVARVPDAPKLI